MARNHPVHTDKPVEVPGDDKLGRAGFSKQLAGTLVSAPAGDALVVGLYGQWGAGKTSVLNLVEHELGELAKGGTSNVAVVKFNPWYFKGEEALIERFFDALAEGLGSSPESTSTQIVSALRRYGRYLKPLSSLAGIAAGLAVPGGHIMVEAASKALDGAASAVSGVTDEAAGALESKEGLADARDRVAKLLRDSGTRIVVFIDDVDRLYADDVRTLFKLVRLVGDLPNVSYLLAFDPDVVAGCLAQAGHKPGDLASGYAFIEKIVQVAIPLPQVRREALRELVLRGMIDAINESCPEIEQDEIWRLVNIWDRSIGARLRTVREGKRILNAAQFAIRQLAGEVDPIDLALFEALRIFAPKVADEIRAAPGLVLSAPQPGPYDPNERSPLKRVLEGLADRDPADLRAVSELLRELFPRIGGRYACGSEWNGRWRKQQRIASVEHLEKALHYGVPAGVVSDVMFSRFIDGLSGGELGVGQVEKALAELAANAGWKDIVLRLRAEVSDLPPAQAEQLARGVVAGAAQYSSQDGIMGLLPTKENAGWLVAQALRRSDDPVALARELVAAAPDVAFTALLLRSIRVDADDSERPQGWDAVEQAALETFGTLADGKLTGPSSITPNDGNVITVLYWWRQAIGVDAFEAKLRAWFDEDHAAAARLASCSISDGWLMETGMPTRGDLTRNNYEAIASLVDPQLVADALGDATEPDIGRERYFQAKEMDRVDQARLQFLYIHRLVTRPATQVSDEAERPTADDAEETEGEADDDSL